MTTQQDSVDVERLRAALQALESACDGLAATRSRETYLSMVDHDHATPQLEAMDEARRNARAALSLPITQRDEQAKTYADGVEDAAKVAERSAAYFRDFAVTNGASDEGAEAARIACDDLATAIRRLSIEQGANQ